MTDLFARILHPAGTGDQALDDELGIVCPSCFAESYAAVHPRAIFELLATDPAAPSTPTPAERPDPLPYFAYSLSGVGATT